MVKFTWQHNLPMEFYSTFEMPLGRLDCGALQATNGTPLKLQNKQSEK